MNGTGDRPGAPHRAPKPLASTAAFIILGSSFRPGHRTHMITNFGSCCVDNVYQVPHFVNPGETLPCSDYQVHPGGKGLNQSLALAFAGAKVRHAGKIGHDGAWMKDLLSNAGVDTDLMQVMDGPSGHAIIQITPDGENSIVLFGGANKTITVADLEVAMAQTTPGEFLLIQNEISCLPELIDLAARFKQRTVFNAAPITPEVLEYPLDKIEVFIVNEIEGEAISGASEPQAILDSMLNRFPSAKIVLTLGADGVIYQDAEKRIAQPARSVSPIDTTGAGDTFTGYFLAGYSLGEDISRCLKRGCEAAAVCVTRAGAASSIPKLSELAG